MPTSAESEESYYPGFFTSRPRPYVHTTEYVELVQILSDANIKCSNEWSSDCKTITMFMTSKRPEKSYTMKRMWLDSCIIDGGLDGQQVHDAVADALPKQFACIVEFDFYSGNIPEYQFPLETRHMFRCSVLCCCILAPFEISV